MEKDQLAEFLRTRRARIGPEDVGLPSGARRRTPGLRREEVARLADMSVDYYIRLEQGRGPNPSRQILGALARALRLSDDERTHLFNLAGEPPVPPQGPPQDVPPGIVHLLERMDDTPAYVLDAAYNVLAWNAMAAALIADFSVLPPNDRNPMRWFFLVKESADICPESEYFQFARESAADLRAAQGRYPNDPGIRSLLDELHEKSALFRLVWAEHDVEVRRTNKKTMTHPAVGKLELHCDVLLVPEKDQKVILYTATPGTESHEALKLLRVIGTQKMQPENSRVP
ncbi:helix-turn-helix transcriptional regulator [Actinomadura rupiterrae]|uniref:helix-turn-helix transcriptional regulator n=1 Tax=Actinomadura rupiterrae TaxID=559627 RepID=UPI0020A58419|nr:helix-turn-helix transcriptional regulator [Actinomadura rupiterrae]MCP2343838.1 transcriptional regulator with XRE-family HTH domain [Actinomadura rupiterrae]